MKAAIDFIVLPGALAFGFYLNKHDYMGRRSDGVQDAVPPPLRPLSCAILGSPPDTPEENLPRLGKGLIHKLPPALDDSSATSSGSRAATAAGKKADPATLAQVDTAAILRELARRSAK